MIESVAFENLRGLKAEYTLGAKTLVLGPNGAGKSSIAHAANLAILGYVPDDSTANKKPDYVFANSATDEMQVSAVVNGHTIRRSWKKGKSISQKVAIDDTKEQTASAAQGMLELALGKEPVLFDVPAFWSQPASEQRRILISTVCDSDDFAKLMLDEKKARDAKNTIASDRRAAEKALEALMESLNNMGEPDGDLAQIKEELKNLQKEQEKLRQKIAEARSAEKSRAKLMELVDSIEDTKAELAHQTEQFDQLDERGKKLQVSIDELKCCEPEKPQQTLHPNDPTTPVIEEAIEELAGLDYGQWSEEDAQQFLRAFHALQSVLPDVEADKSWDKQWREWHERIKAQQDEIRQVASQMKEVSERIRTLTERIKGAEEAETKLAEIGAGVDPNDVAAENGVKSRIQELDRKREALIERGVTERESENLRIRLKALEEDQEKANKALTDIVMKQANIVDSASDQLAVRSKEVLPYGNLRLEDDGTNLHIYWAKDGNTRVRRHTLSGGEKSAFDAAMGHALAPAATVVIEAAECDDKNLVKILDHLAEKDFQVIVLTCHKPAFDIPKGWKTVEVSE